MSHLAKGDSVDKGLFADIILALKCRVLNRGIMNDAVLSDNLNSYIAGINKYPLLTAEEEFGLAERYFRDTELDAPTGSLPQTSGLWSKSPLIQELRVQAC